jgi:BMFP domain-containing protein YqiC
MIKTTTLLQDMAQLAGGAAELIGGASQQIRDDAKTRMEEIADNMNLVPREDLERVEALLEQSLKQQKDMLARIEKLEARK